MPASKAFSRAASIDPSSVMIRGSVGVAVGVDALGAAMLARLETVAYRIGDGVRTGLRAHPISLAFQGLPPIARGLFRVLECEDGGAVRVLQVVSETEPLLG